MFESVLLIGYTTINVTSKCIVLIIRHPALYGLYEHTKILQHIRKDLYIIGQFVAVVGTTTVSIGSQVMHMLTVMIVGLATTSGSVISVIICVIAFSILMRKKTIGREAM